MTNKRNQTLTILLAFIIKKHIKKLRLVEIKEFLETYFFKLN